MKKKYLIALSVCLLVISFAVTAVCGSRYTYSYDLTRTGTGEPSGAEGFAEGFRVTAEDPGIVGISGIRTEGDLLTCELIALGKGYTYLQLEPEFGEPLLIDKIYVHTFGIITVNTFFGRCTGGFLLPLSVLIIIALLYAERIGKLRARTRENMYSYRNIMDLGLIVFLTFLLLKLLMVVLRFRGTDAAVSSVLATASTLAMIVLPLAFIIFVLVSLSNLNLMRREGVNWRNMLGFLLGVALCLLTVLPDAVYGYIMNHQTVDIFDERAVATYLYSFIEHSVFFAVAYLECLLLGTAVFALKAARHVPAFDKDYILIPGSQIRADGTLTPLLQARADRAVEFAAMQKEACGRDIIFVPSGGKGADEAVSEAGAIGAYLRSKGLPEERILIEDQSRNTYENVRNSMKLIAEDYADRRNGKAERIDNTAAPKTAFSTTNYHVFRTGLIASELGYRLEGIGSPTKRYFWINAFIREFIATMASERKSHLKVIAVLIGGVIVLTALQYMAALL